MLQSADRQSSIDNDSADIYRAPIGEVMEGGVEGWRYYKAGNFIKKTTSYHNMELFDEIAPGHRQNIKKAYSTGYGINLSAQLAKRKYS